MKTTHIKHFIERAALIGTVLAGVSISAHAGLLGGALPGSGGSISGAAVLGVGHVFAASSSQLGRGSLNTGSSLSTRNSSNTVSGNAASSAGDIGSSFEANRDSINVSSDSQASATAVSGTWDPSNGLRLTRNTVSNNVTIEKETTESRSGAAQRRTVQAANTGQDQAGNNADRAQTSTSNTGSEGTGTAETAASNARSKSSSASESAATRTRTRKNAIVSSAGKSADKAADKLASQASADVSGNGAASTN